MKQVVDDFSSKVDLPPPFETVESLDADHRQMARCSSRTDPQYRSITGVLKQFMRRQLPSKRYWLGLVMSDRVDAAICRDRDGFIADLLKVVDAVVKPIPDLSELGYRLHIEGFSHRWSLGFVWQECSWVGGSYKGYEVINPGGYMMAAETRREHLGLWRAHDAGFLNQSRRMNRWLVMDTLYGIMEYLGIDD